MECRAQSSGERLRRRNAAVSFFLTSAAPESPGRASAEALVIGASVTGYRRHDPDPLDHDGACDDRFPLPALRPPVVLSEMLANE